jgi:hypothetical protein
VPRHLVGLAMLLGCRYHPDEEVEVHRSTALLCILMDGCHAFDLFLTIDTGAFYGHGPRQERGRASAIVGCARLWSAVHVCSLQFRFHRGKGRALSATKGLDDLVYLL